MQNWLNDPNWPTLLVLLGIIALIALAMRRPRFRGSGWKFGTGHWTTRQQLKQKGMLTRGGLLLGRLPDTLEPIWLHEFHHLSIVIPTGGGKTVSYLGPWLMTWEQSVVVVDPKAELFKLFADRRRAMGQKIVVLDPFKLAGPNSDGINVFDLIPDGPECVDPLRAAATALVVIEPEERDKHWPESAANLLLILMVAMTIQLPPEDRSFTALLDLLCDPQTHAVLPQVLRAKGGVFAQLGGLMAQWEDKEKAGIYSTAMKNTAFLMSVAIINVLSKSTFDLRELLKGETTLFIILPPSQIEAQSRFMRLIITTVIQLISREGMAPGKKCLFLLDETAALGPMPALDQGLQMLRSYGAHFVLVWQSLAQLKSIFREKEAMVVDNTDLIVSQVRSVSTAEPICKALGSETITVGSMNAGNSTNWSGMSQGQSANTQYSQNDGWNYSEKSRELLTIDELLNLDPGLAIVLCRGMAPLLLKRAIWYADPLFSNAKRLPWLWWGLIASAVGLIGWAVSGFFQR
ncbi:MAG TPA: type IV secretory system conjugative DNA transfer family protein [Gemmataceae bacterium]|nr:type IV secretory system conjugative DNA transfer family protein [Gemmataceae bacterium]